MSQFGLSEDELRTLTQIVIEPLVSAGAKVWCFGSRARGDHKKFSDIDLMVESERDMTLLVGKVKEDIVESNFPYKVDIVELKNFSKQYRENFESEKVLWKKTHDFNSITAKPPPGFISPGGGNPISTNRDREAKSLHDQR